MRVEPDVELLWAFTGPPDRLASMDTSYVIEELPGTEVPDTLETELRSDVNDVS